MSFRIFAAGTPDFHFERDDNPDNDIFDTATVLNAFRSSSPTPMSVVEGVADYYTPNSLLEGLNAIATIEFLHMLKSAVTFLAMRPKASQGWIAIYPRESHLLWPDTVGAGEYKFRPGDDPGVEFFQAIKPALVKTDMNNYGMLRMLAVVLTMYNQHIRDSDPVMIQMQLFH